MDKKQIYSLYIDKSSKEAVIEEWNYLIKTFTKLCIQKGDIFKQNDNCFLSDDRAKLRKLAKTIIKTWKDMAEREVRLINEIKIKTKYRKKQ